MLENYTYEKLHYIAGIEKLFKNGTYPMDTRRRSYFCFYNGKGGYKDTYTVKIYNTPIYRIDKDNIITWLLHRNNYDVGTTRILNNGVHWSSEYHAAIAHKSNYGGVVYTKYRMEDNPKYKDYKGKILNETASMRVRKVAEMIPLVKGWQYKIVKIDSNIAFSGDSIEPVTKYDVIQRKLNAKRGHKVRESVMEDKETFKSVMNMLNDSQQRESFFTDLVSKILNTQNVFQDRRINIRTHPEKCRHFQKLAKEHSVVADVFVANYLGGFITSAWNLRHFVTYHTDFIESFWSDYLTHLYDLNNAYDEKYHPCELKKYPSNRLIKLQKREV